MANKKSTRRVPTVRVAGNMNYNHEHLLNSKEFVGSVYYETISGIEEALNCNRKTATLFSIEDSENYIEIEKEQWLDALESCIDYYSETEEYELCNEIQKLKTKIK
jgi:hypothetical protein